LPLAPCHSTLDLVASLVDKSLLQVEEVGGEARYAPLETIREFGLERLAASGEEDAARERHTAWYLAFAENAGPRAKQPGAPPWIAKLEREHPNLRAALNWLLDRGDGPRLLRMAGSLWPFWQEHTYYGEGHRWLELALDLGQGAPAAESILALTGAGTLAWYQTRIEQALLWHEQALALARAAGDRVAQASTGRSPAWRRAWRSRAPRGKPRRWPWRCTTWPAWPGSAASWRPRVGGPRRRWR
jgi:non-specific serine/threonine protein kinase